MVETQCRYRAPIRFPDRVTAGLRVARLGTTSVRYEVGLFRGHVGLAELARGRGDRPQHRSSRPYAAR